MQCELNCFILIGFYFTLLISIVLKAASKVEGDSRIMCDSGLTGFMYSWAPAAPTSQYINPVNPMLHIWRSPSSISRKRVIKEMRLILSLRDSKWISKVVYFGGSGYFCHRGYFRAITKYLGVKKLRGVNFISQITSFLLVSTTSMYSK